MKTSIIIPVYNRLEYTKKCLDSIFKSGSKYPFEIIIVDNASSDETKEFLDNLIKKIITIHNIKNLGFAKACNQGAKLAKGEYLLFLNNDTIVTDDWMDELVKELDNNPEIAIAGSKLLFPDETIQHAGVVFREDKIPYHIYVREKKEQLYVNKKRIFQCVTGACLLIRHPVFNEVGGFDEKYLNGYEDIDLCLKVGKLGKSVLYCPGSVVYHYEGISEGRLNKENENQKLFFRKWYNEIKVDYKDFMISDHMFSETKNIEQENARLKNEINKILNSRTYRWNQKIALNFNNLFPLFTKRRKLLVSILKLIVKLYRIIKKISYFPRKFIIYCYKRSKKIITKITKIKTQFLERKYKNKMGINIFGYFLSEIGLGEAARLLTKSILTTNISFKLISLDDDCPQRKKDLTILKISKLSKSNPYSINLVIVGAESGRLLEEKKKNNFSEKYNIGCWFWELNEFPDIWLNNFDYYREIWASSDFIANSIKKKSPIPVIKIPLPIQIKKINRVNLSYFGLKTGIFTFLFMFDFYSEFERKNPLAIIQAFKKVFTKNDNVQLIIKSSNCSYNMDNLKKMKAEAEKFPIYFIDEYLLKEEVDTLTSLCDCYVSLHHSEGFGLTMAEAMYLKKPVIATNYSGNTEFMNKNNSYLVNYKLAEIKRDAGPYKKGQIWAEPDIAHAGNLMRYVYDNPEKAKKMGEMASDYIKKEFSFEAIGEKIKKRINDIYNKK